MPAASAETAFSAFLQNTLKEKLTKTKALKR
jgi:hypothetical protein